MGFYIILHLQRSRQFFLFFKYEVVIQYIFYIHKGTADLNTILKISNIAISSKEGEKDIFKIRLVFKKAG